MDAVPADLLLPRKLLLFSLRLKGAGEWRDMVARLVDRHRARVLKVADGANHHRFHYQTAGLDLQRVCYIPYRDVIVQLRMLSYASRISMCALVVLMLQWEQEQLEHAELAGFTGVTIEFHSAWAMANQILTVTAAIQMPVTRAPPVE